MAKIIRTIAPILLLVFISGCAGLQGIDFGTDVIKANPISAEEGFRDVIIISDIGTIPKSPVIPDQNILFSFVIENRDKEKKAENVIIDLFDAPMFKNPAKNNLLCNTAAGKCLSDKCSENSPCTILPGEQKQITFSLKPPSTAELANLQSVVDLSFSVRYSFAGTTLLKTVVVNQDEIKERQRAGSSVSIDVTKSFGSGPMKIDAELKGSPFILSPFGANIAFSVKSLGDPGRGSLLNSKIQKSETGKEIFKIEFPKELTSLANIEYPEEFFTCYDAGKIKCVNDKKGDDITLFRGESTSLFFRLKNSPAITIPFKSFDIKAELNYVYELRDSAKVTVKPIGAIK